jgi:Flp pilus assembly protein TadG
MRSLAETYCGVSAAPTTILMKDTSIDRPEKARVSNAIRIFLGDERGDEMIEFAIASLVLFTCLLGIMGSSLLFYAYHFTSYAAREATRYAMVRGSTWGSIGCSSPTTMGCNATGANVTTFVQSIVTPGISGGSQLSVVTSWPGTGLAGSVATCSTTNGNNSPGCLVLVQVNYSFSYLLPFMPTTALALRSSSEVVILR